LEGGISEIGEKKRDVCAEKRRFLLCRVKIRVPGEYEKKYDFCVERNELWGQGLKGKEPYIFSGGQGEGPAFMDCKGRAQLERG